MIIVKHMPITFYYLCHLFFTITIITVLTITTINTIARYIIPILYYHTFFTSPPSLACKTYQGAPQTPPRCPVPRQRPRQAAFMTEH